ncbi:MAG: aminotransferase [Alphaproteobacteria bacterium]|nr:aminotransferase [Alphaproteobacteria bacterium]
MSFAINPLVLATLTPPIAEAWSWVQGRDFPTNRPLIDVCQAVPGYPPPDELERHVAERAMLPETARYTDIAGIAPLRAGLAADINALYGGQVAAENVVITAGCNQAFWNAIVALARTGDEVILPLPFYFNHQMTLQALGIAAVPLPCDVDAGGVPDPRRAAELITPLTRAIVLVTPNNPTGAVYPPATIRAFYQLARARGIALLVDETYRDFLAEGARPHDVFLDRDWAEGFVHLYSFSKVYSLTGYRCGAAVCGPGLRDAIAKVADCVQISAPRIGQDAALYGLGHLDAWRKGNSRMMAERASALRSAFTTAGLNYRLLSCGAYFAYVRHPFTGESSVGVARRLATDHNILCLPGSFFGPGQEAYLRFAFANLDAGWMPEIARRLIDSQG